jgi:hypothetical protein
MFGRKKDLRAEAHPAESKFRENPESEPAEPADADVFMRHTLRTLDQTLALKREAREKTQRFVGSLRSFAKVR